MKLATNMGGGWSHYGLAPARMIEEIAKTGFRNTDYTFWTMDAASPLMQPGWERHIDEVIVTSESTGVKIIQAHSPAGNPLATLDYDDLVRRTIRSIECCARMGTPRIIVHPGAYPGITLDQFHTENRRFYETLVPTIEAAGVEVLVENIGTRQDPHHVHTGAELRDMVEIIDHPLVGACWDTGHGNVAGVDQYESLRELGSLLKGVHIQDNAGAFDVKESPYRQDLHTLPFLGSVNFDAVVQGLIDIDYSGYFTFEVSVPRTYDRREFVYDGKPVTTLEWPPLEICVQLHTVLYAMGAHMLQQYGIFEE